MTMNVILVMLILVMCIVIIWFVVSLYILYRLHKQHEKLSQEVVKLTNDTKSIEYSSNVLDFIKNMVSQISTVKVSSFIDKSDAKKITKSQIEKVVVDVATTVRQSISMKNIKIENTMYTQVYFDQYIIDLSVYSVKKALEAAIEKAEME